MVTRHAEEQRRYRARLRERAKAGATGSRGAPETRIVVQGLAVAVRRLAEAVRKAPDGPEALVYERLMRTAHRHLTRQGFDAAESYTRLSHYTLPDDAKARRRRADAERRFWASGDRAD
ncbi:hypothetical protein SI859A1_01348 [Aurantimonas manganoxydans SI85-9A1]|jgi:hypothetical protein|uniref:Uncharacterized protein n=1 Tax=Aurantimonas manganoxydans (strain ATCC BAA-1229 / DSM 21871 / SI85-9A1) TaxID=287752 RepID=Q1YIX2_AURMS|nr:hypothetical protein SI859A1_01348 [Aurantimonas manganoxydans SI85-9A1]